MEYLKYLWKTDLRKLSRKEKALAILIFVFSPVLGFIVIGLWTLTLNMPIQAYLAIGMLIGWYAKGAMGIVGYALEPTSANPHITKLKHS